ncbi:MAG TPA: hypothetical protein VHA11_04890 [Bryobacteraceae bacterium]|nr:hypothetical protein [Bryobacteraceae bacterium]
MSVFRACLVAALGVSGCAALAQSPAPITLLEDTLQVPAAAWRSFDLELKQRPAIIDCRFAVRGGGSGVRVAVMRRADLVRLREGQGHRVLAATSFEQGGTLRVPVPPGEYSLVLDNRMEGRGPAQVWVQASIVFAAGPPEARVLSPQRRAVVIAASLLFFFAVVLVTGRRLQRALAHRPGPPPFSF